MQALSDSECESKHTIFALSYLLYCFIASFYSSVLYYKNLFKNSSFRRQ